MSGPGAAAGRVDGADEQQEWPGQRLGLPSEGPGSATGGWRRFFALLLDLVLASLVTSLFVRPQIEQASVMQTYNYTAVLIWVTITVLPVALFGFTPGMAAVGARVARLDGAGAVGVWRAVVRCVLTFLLLPPLIRDVDRRGWHDRATGTAVVRLR